MWIRSQDRMQLVKVSAISITYDDGQPRRIVGYERDRTWVLARYKSEERALEILKEIQNLQSAGLNGVVYTMPKE